LEALSLDQHVEIRAEAANHHYADAAVLNKALDDPDPYVRLGAAGNPNATEAVLLKAAADKDQSVRHSASCHPDATREVLAVVNANGGGADNEAFVRTFWRNATEEDLLWAVKSHGWAAEQAVLHQNATLKVLKQALASHTELNVLQAVASSHLADEGILTYMQRSRDAYLPVTALNNPNATAAVRLKALQSKQPKIAAIAFAMMSGDTVPDTISDAEADALLSHALELSNDFDIAPHLSKHPRASESVLLKALSNPSVWVRKAAVTHPNATETVLLQALSDPKPTVRASAVKHPNATEAVFLKGISDTGTVVDLLAEQGLFRVYANKTKSITNNEQNKEQDGQEA
jgi:hypothetical protein